MPMLWRLKRKRAQTANAAGGPPLYFFAHALNWWAQFEDQCQVEIKPWDVMCSDDEEVLLINDTIAFLAYQLCSWVERKHPRTAARLWHYPLVILTKNG